MRPTAPPGGRPPRCCAGGTPNAAGAPAATSHLSSFLGSTMPVARVLGTQPPKQCTMPVARVLGAQPPEQGFQAA
eukprot:1159684-Pelagomonas_calceolata.AAC.3